MCKDAMHKLFATWLDDKGKALVSLFFQRNPGVVDTPDGLARRLGTTLAAIDGAIEAHVELGLLRRRTVGDKTLLIYDKSSRTALEQRLAAHIAHQKGQGGEGSRE